MKTIFLTLLLAGLVGAAQAQRLVTQTATLTPGQPVALTFKYARQIRVRPGAGAALTVQARVVIANNALNESYALQVQPGPDGELRLEEKMDEQLIRRYLYDDWRGRHHPDGDPALRIDYEVTLPAATPLRLKTVAGDLDAAGLTGDLILSTVSGDLTLADLRGALRVHTVSGDIRLRGLAGTAPVEALTVSGDVDASWPPAQGAELSLKSLSGEVYADPAATFTNLKARHYVGYELRGQVAAGRGPLVSLHTVSGDVFFRQQ